MRLHLYPYWKEYTKQNKKEKGHCLQQDTTELVEFLPSIMYMPNKYMTSQCVQIFQNLIISEVNIFVLGVL